MLYITPKFFVKVSFTLFLALSALVIYLHLHAGRRNQYAQETSAISPNAGELKTNQALQGQLADSYLKLPLSFEENKGQTDSRVKFLSRGDGYALFLTSDGATLSLRKPQTGKPKASGPSDSRSLAQPTDGAADVLHMHLVGANRAAQVVGEGELSGKSNYITGNDVGAWRTDISTFEKIKYESVYPGVDLVYYGNQRKLEYDFIVAPGIDTRIVKVAFQGARALALNDEGDLVLKAQASEVRLHKPISYQLINGERREVASSYAINGRNEIGFKVGDYDRSQPLIIDPVLVYSTYLGGSSSGNFTVEETANSIFVDAAGNAYITGTTTSTDFPVANAYKSNGGGFSDVFVSKLNPAGTTLLYSTYLGGNRDDYGNGIAVDASGAAYVVGISRSTDFPTTAGALQTTGLDIDVFVTKLNAAGNALVYSTLLSGDRSTEGASTLASSEEGYAIAVNAQGEAIVVGDTQSANFPTANPVQPTRSAGWDMFVTKLNAAGTGLVFSTYFGGSNQDNARGVVFDSAGNAYITGSTYSKDFPTTNGAFKTANGADGTDGVVAKFAPNGALIYSTYVGGDSYDTSRGIAVDALGNAFITGDTISNNFPVTQTALKKSFSKGAVFRGTGAGAFWKATALTNQFTVNVVAVDPINSSTLYAGTESGIYKSTDGGSSWTALGLTNIRIEAVAVDPGNPSRIFAGTWDQGIYKSVDGGANWMHPLAGGTINTFTFHPSDSNKVYAGTGNGSIPGDGALISIDGGDNWTTFRAVTGRVKSIVFDPSTPSTVYMCVNSSISKSVDGGATWNTVLQSSQLTSLAIDPKTPSTLYATSSSFGIHKTTDGGATWNIFNSGLGSQQAISIAVDPVTPSTIYVGISDNGVYRSTNGGNSWNQTGLIYSSPKVVIAPSNPSVMYAASSIFQADAFITGLNATGSALVYSGYFGGTGFDRANAIAIDSSNNLYIAGTTNSIDFPQLQAMLLMNGVATEAFIVKLKSSDMSLQFSTYLGGSNPDTANGVAVDGSGNIYLAGQTRSANFPTASALQSNLNQIFDPFVMKVSAPAAPGAQYPLSGRVTDINGNGIGDVTLTVSGSLSGQTLSVQTDADGNYSFSNAVEGDTLTPSKAGYIFNPSSVKAVSSNGFTIITGTFNFTGATALYTFSGQVIDGTGAGLGGVLMTLGGSMQGSVLTDANGNFTIGNLFAGGNYTITPSKSGYFFNPSRVSLNNLSGNRTRTFVGTTHPYSIIGQIKDAGNNGLSSVTVTLSRAGGSETLVTLTDANGNYAFGNVAGEATYTVTPSKAGFTFSPPSATFNNPSGNQTANFTATATPVVQFNQANYIYNESDALGYAVITVTRTGDKSAASTVQYSTSDQSGGNECNQVTGFASQRCDYATVAGTLRFAAGEETKQIQIPIVSDGYIEGPESFNIKLQSPTGASLGTASEAVITIGDKGTATTPTENPYLNNAFFVRMNYLDFLSREPDQAGFTDWTTVLNNCGSQQGFLGAPFDCDRAHVSHGFFASPEFTNRGFLIYRLYAA
ncbi:MAG: SBBP repeat-containing protein, partial [Pyrinomonadaceae bacterium]|nr:SBBP repeat-containing protein [Pyrinomonadaceae bacterium]